jgi:multimeric flavodoxin WrbA
VDITILNGNSIPNNRIFDDYLKGLAATLEMQSHFVTQINLAEKEIKQCMGCWNCWVKTPGKCTIIDDMKLFFPDLIKCDLLIMASPIRMGFTSALLEKVKDRMIPLVMPYFKIVNGEFHHKERYPKYPKLGLIFEGEITTDDDDLTIIKNIYERLAINFHSELKFFHEITQSERELINEINNI